MTAEKHRNLGKLHVFVQLSFLLGIWVKEVVVMRGENDSVWTGA